METQTLEENCRVIYADEMKMGLFPRMFREWSIPGMRHEVDVVCADEGKRTLFGGVDISTGELTLVAREKGRSIDFIEFCDAILTKYPNDTIYMPVDNYIIHRSKEFQKYYAMQPRLNLVFLPSYSFYLNVIELLWLYVRKKVCYNNQFRKLDWLVEEILRFLNNLEPQRVLKAVGIKTGH